MNLTPRQMMAYLEFNDEIDRTERAGALLLDHIAAQGDQKTIETTIKQLTDAGKT